MFIQRLKMLKEKRRTILIPFLRIPLCVMSRCSAVPDSSQLYSHGFLSVPRGPLVAPLGLSSLPETFHARRLVTAGSLAPLSSFSVVSSLLSTASSQSIAFVVLNVVKQTQFIMMNSEYFQASSHLKSSDRC